MTPFRSEKNTNWEGAFRIPELIRWPGKIPAGVVSNEIVQHHDWLPTFLAAAGEPDVVEKLKAGHTAGDKTFKVHIDGYNLLPYLTGEVDKSPRQGFVYFSDDGDVLALRFDNWKIVFMEQRVQGTLQIWAEPFVVAARAEAVQPAHGPVRAGRHHLEHLLGLDARQRLPRARRDVRDDASSSRRSRSSRRGRRRRASRSTRRSPSSRRSSPRATESGTVTADGMAWIPAGTFAMGSDDHYPEEAPAHRVAVDGFWIDRLPGDEPRVRGVRRGDRLRHRRRAAARSGRLPGAPRREPRARARSSSR